MNPGWPPEAVLNTGLPSIVLLWESTALLSPSNNRKRAVSNRRMQAGASKQAVRARAEDGSPDLASHAGGWNCAGRIGWLTRERVSTLGRYATLGHGVMPESCRFSGHDVKEKNTFFGPIAISAPPVSGLQKEASLGSPVPTVCPLQERFDTSRWFPNVSLSTLVFCPEMAYPPRVEGDRPSYRSDCGDPSRAGKGPCSERHTSRETAFICSVSWAGTLHPGIQNS